jgi:membrane protein YqaA with SNARE-associated domain
LQAVSILFEYGLLGLFISGFLAGTVVPFSSEAVLSVLLLNGFDWIDCLVVATVGNLIGGVITYYMGWLGKWEWVEKYWRIPRKKIEATKIKLDRYGALLATLSFVPGLGNVLVLGLGFFRISPALSVLFMFAGKVARYLVWGYATQMFV